jgi:hypothetical protein
VGVFAETQISGRLRGIGEAGVGVQYSASSESILLGSRKQSSRSSESSEGVALAALFNLQAHLVLPFVVQRLSMPVILDLLLLSKGICGLPLTPVTRNSQEGQLQVQRFGTHKQTKEEFK